MDIHEQIVFLDNLFKGDQEYRLAYMSATTTEEKEKYSKKATERDKENLQSFLEFVEKYGWPVKSKHGEAYAVGFFIIQHSNLAIMEKYLPILKQHAETGEAKASHSAMMEDRILMLRNQPQKYGSQAAGGKIWPIEDAAHVDERRAKVGFSNTIEEYAVLLDAKFDPTLKIEDF